MIFKIGKYEIVIFHIRKEKKIVFRPTGMNLIKYLDKLII
jgi:hypothetical protein